MLLNGGGWDGTKLEWFVRIELNIILNIYMWFAVNKSSIIIIFVIKSRNINISIDWMLANRYLSKFANRFWVEWWIEIANYK
jgi:hypothetical protein